MVVVCVVEAEAEAGAVSRAEVEFSEQEWLASAQGSKDLSSGVSRPSTSQTQRQIQTRFGGRQLAPFRRLCGLFVVWRVCGGSWSLGDHGPRLE